MCRSQDQKREYALARQHPGSHAVKTWGSSSHQPPATSQGLKNLMRSVMRSEAQRRDRHLQAEGQRRRGHDRERQIMPCGEESGPCSRAGELMAVPRTESGPVLHLHMSFHPCGRWARLLRRVLLRRRWTECNFTRKLGCCKTRGQDQSRQRDGRAGRDDRSSLTSIRPAKQSLAL
jgi:hypothetical protein